MTAKAKVAGLGMTLAVLGAALSWWMANNHHATETAIKAATQERRKLDAESKALEARIAGLLQQRANVERAMADAATQPAAPTEPRPPAAPAAGPAVFQPAQQAAAVKRFKARLPLDYYALYRANGWSAEQIEKFEEALVEHDGRRRDLMSAASERKLASNDPAIATLRREEDERFDAALREAVGEEGLQRFKSFQADAPERRRVGELVGALALTPSPLSPSQTQQLGEAFKTNRVARGGGADGWDAVLAQARTYLDATQWAELEAQAHSSQIDAAMSELSRLAQAAEKAKK
jgi:hypothetical protein